MSYPVKNIVPLRCLVVGGEPVVSSVADMTGNVDFLTVTATCASTMEAEAFMQEDPVDVLFLDADLPGLSELETLSELDSPPLAIFIATHSDCTPDDLPFQVADRLVKPIQPEQLLQAVERARDMFLEGEGLPDMCRVGSGRSPYLHVRHNNGSQKIVKRDILFVEDGGNYVTFVMTGREIVADQTMASIERMLPEDAFFRIHRSFLVNVHRIGSISSSGVLVGDYELPLSSHRKDELMESVVYRNLVGG